VLTEEEFIPFDPPVVSKYGPISREGTKIPVGNPQNFPESPTAGLRSPVAWVYNNPQGTLIAFRNYLYLWILL
jgi:hypothetical protein